MGGKSIGHRRDAFKQRERLMKMQVKDIFEKDPETIPAEINTKESVCQHCDFKARYKFLRCPECNSEQK